MENFDAKKFALMLKRKVGAGMLIIALLCVTVTFSTLFTDDIHLWWSIIALVLFFVLRRTILVWYAKKLYALINDDLAPDRLLDVIREGKFYSRNAILELTAYLAAGRWQQVADICAQKLNDPTLAAEKCNYMAYLADMYFSLGDDTRLREIVDAYDAYAAAIKPNTAIKRWKDSMVYYRNYLDGAYAECFAEWERRRQKEKNHKVSRYIQIVRSYKHGVVFYRAGHMEEAQVLFERVVADAPQLALAMLSEEYLRALREGGEPCFGERVAPSGQDALPPIPKSHRVLHIVARVAMTVALIMLAVVAVLLLVVEILL